ncbi:hypothetical protein ONE63_004033 [Megalurothrips usitatus]|uniref:Regulatory protein zeste n=1 Tax=Megalurothrips usitatus TaxID=439358 RepID=A0AAV7X978_9NEOP|nr:hypothetical protein ONE63_004033 [Megalurothrips usitatus]
MTDYTRNVSSSSSNNMHHVSSSSNNGGRPVSILPNMSIQNMSNWSNLMNMNMANMANMNNMNYPMMRPSFTVKQRKTNFTQREVDALINSVRKHQDTVLFGVAGGPGWAKAWTQVAAAVSAVEGIVRSEGDVRKKWTYLKWEAKNTSKPDRDSTSRAVLQILTSRQNQIDAANHHAANLRADMRVNDVLRGESLREAVQSSRSLLEELLGKMMSQCGCEYFPCAWKIISGNMLSRILELIYFSIELEAQISGLNFFPVEWLDVSCHVGLLFKMFAGISWGASR